MSIIGWSLLVMMNYMCIYSSSTLKLGGMILALSVSISFLMSLSYLSWLSLMFFIIYIGGLLVLFFYLSSLNYNPLLSLAHSKVYSSSMVKMNIILLLFLTSMNYLFTKKNFKFTKKNFKKFSNSLFKDEEFKSLILVGVMLLIVLWVMTKLTFNTRGALRPTF